MSRRLLGAALSICFAAAVIAYADDPVVRVTKPIKLFNGKNLDGFYTFLKDTKYEDPRGVFTIKDGLLVVSGDGMGGVITKDRYADYRVVCDGNRITVYLNDVLVNMMTDASLTSGKIAIQSELPEIHIRRFDLFPLDPER